MSNKVLQAELSLRKAEFRYLVARSMLASVAIASLASFIATNVILSGDIKFFMNLLLMIISMLGLGFVSNLVFDTKMKALDADFAYQLAALSHKHDDE